MSLRTTLQKLIRRDPTGSLRERATELRGSLSRRTVVAGTVAAAVPLPALAATVAPVRPATAHSRSLRFLDTAGELLAAVFIIGGGMVLTGLASLL